MEECINFGIEAGMMPEQDREFPKMLQAIKRREAAGLQGTEECDSYCSEDSHIDECMNFGSGWFYER